jgi:hypothetical protein
VAEVLRKSCIHGNNINEFALIKLLAKVVPKDQHVAMTKNDPVIVMVAMATHYSIKKLIEKASNKRGI